MYNLADIYGPSYGIATVNETNPDKAEVEAYALQSNAVAENVTPTDKKNIFMAIIGLVVLSVVFHII